MCDHITYYYCYRNCRLPEKHGYSVVDMGSGRQPPCSSSPHVLYKYEPGDCGLCVSF